MVWRSVLLALSLLLLAGCAGDPDALRIERLESGGWLRIGFNLSPYLSRSLEAGVPLTFRLDYRNGESAVTERRELRYSPLSGRYQIRVPAGSYNRSYDSRAAALSALERWPVTLSAGADQFQARVRLETARLPSPLVLPAMFDSRWRLDSGTWRAGPT